MIEELDDAEHELKRADHLVYVTLKMTRTADVIKNTIKRLINACDTIIIEALTFAKEKKKIKYVALTPTSRYEDLEKLIKDKRIKDYIKFYNLLKKIDRAEYSKRNEYRKNVTLMAIQAPGKFIDVDIPIIVEYYNKTKEFVSFIRSWMSGEIK